MKGSSCGRNISSIICRRRRQKCYQSLHQASNSRSQNPCSYSTSSATMSLASSTSSLSNSLEQQQQQFRRRNMWSSSSSSSSSQSFPSSSKASTTTSVSSQEVSKFSNMNSSWWNPTENPLIAMNPIRVQYMLELLRSKGCLLEKKGSSSSDTSNYSPPLEGRKALDVGCGGGLLSESLARLGAHVTAIDPSIPLVDMAQHHAELDWRLSNNNNSTAAESGVGGIEYRGGMSVEELAKEYNNNNNLEDTEKFDIICILEVLEHVTDVDGLLQAASSLLKPQTGMLFVSTMNQTMKSHAIAIVGAEYVMKYLPIGTHDWNKFLSPQEVEKRMARVGLQSVDTCGMVLKHPWSAPPISNWEWKLDRQDLDVNWIGGYQRLS